MDTVVRHNSERWGCSYKEAMDIMLDAMRQAALVGAEMGDADIILGNMNNIYILGGLKDDDYIQ